MKMTDEQNLKFMNDKRRVDAQEKLDNAVEHIKGIQTLSAQTILIYMPQALKKLSEAYENLNVIEAQVEAEIINKINI